MHPELLPRWQAALEETHAAHAEYLKLSANIQATISRHIKRQLDDLGEAAVATEAERHETNGTGGSQTRPQPPEAGPPRDMPAEPPRSLDYDACMEFAIGKLSRCLGPMFAEVDQFPTRVRLPDVPLMLVDRITHIEGEPRSMTTGRVVTEHDVRAGDWYLDCGKIPTSIAVESGQADLFLSGWLGIDFETRGLAVYRLLDAVVTFLSPLPGPGATIVYDIKINGFFRQGSTYLFRFEFDAAVDGVPLMTMRDGCAGFFTEEELAGGKGIIHTALDRQPRPGKVPAGWQPPVPLAPASYSKDQIDRLRGGDLAACFGPAFGDLPLQKPVTLPTGRLNLVDQVLELEPDGGKYGLGRIKAEMAIRPDDWFLTCHFCDDNVMPGTLMYECCLHTLRIYLLRMGWVGEAGAIAYEPVPGVSSKLKCRGQVIESTKSVWYEVTIKELGYGPDAYCLADALMYADGKPIVEITNMSVRLTGLTEEKVNRLWQAKPAAPAIKYDRRPAIYDSNTILAFSNGKPSEAFGDRYQVFDSERKIARLPGPPFQFLDRITAVAGEPWVMKAGAKATAQYDVPADAWYFAANRQPTMPFSVLLETALQPCGWLAAYCGSALLSPTDIRFRNLGGKATLHRPITPETGTLTTEVELTQASNSGGMIIQHYSMRMTCGGEPVYDGTTYFGFFSAASLANQVGLKDNFPDRPDAGTLATAERFPFTTGAPFADDRYRMIDEITAWVPNGGRAGLGYLRGTFAVKPEAWFFQAHFFEDPVVPGSLGLESFQQLLAVYAAKRWTLGPSARFQSVALEQPHEWVYRGQVIPADKLVTVEAAVTSVDDRQRRIHADGFLSVDGRVIYQMKNFTLSVS